MDGLCLLNPLCPCGSLEVSVEEKRKRPRGCGGKAMEMCEREQECMRGGTHLHAKPSNCKNDATCFLLTAKGVLLFHVNLVHAGSQLQFVLFVLFRSQEVFFCFSFLFWKS